MRLSAFHSLKQLTPGTQSNLFKKYFKAKPPITSDCGNTPAQISHVDIIYEFGAGSLAGIVAVLITLGQFGCLLRRLGGSEPVVNGRDTGRGHSSGERAHEPPPPPLTLLPTPKVSGGGADIASCRRAADLNCDVKPGNWM